MAPQGQDTGDGARPPIDHRSGRRPAMSEVGRGRRQPDSFEDPGRPPRSAGAPVPRGDGHLPRSAGAPVWPGDGHPPRSGPAGGDMAQTRHLGHPAAAAPEPLADPVENDGEPLLGGTAADRPAPYGRAHGHEGKGQDHATHGRMRPEGEHGDHQPRRHRGDLPAAPAGDQSPLLERAEPVADPLVAELTDHGGRRPRRRARWIPRRSAGHPPTAAGDRGRRARARGDGWSQTML